MSKTRVTLHDSKVFAGQKNAISIRDGVLEYFGYEIGMEPSDKVFTIYRSPATISNAAKKIPNMPVTPDHIEVGSEVVNAVGYTGDYEMIDMYDESVNSTIAAKHPVQFQDSYSLQDSQELSWGYDADLVEHDIYDLEQKNIEPHHLAIVDRGRCGSSCRFVDKKTVETDEMSQTEKDDVKSVFKDADGNINMQTVIAAVQQLPEAIKSLPIEKLAEIMPPIMEVVDMSKNSSETMDEEEMVEEEEKTEDAEAEEYADEEKPKMQDSAAFKDAVMKATDSAVRTHGAVVEKAKDFLDDTYSFADKSTVEVMRDAVSTQHTEKFNDSELHMAFKMLKMQPAYQNFADSGKSKFADLADKEF